MDSLTKLKELNTKKLKINPINIFDKTYTPSSKLSARHSEVNAELSREIHRLSGHKET